MRKTVSKKTCMVFVVTLSILLLASCGTADSSPAEGSSNTGAVSDAAGAEIEVTADNIFEVIAGKEFCFSAGVGAWGTTLTFQKDGRFKGEYYDADMGFVGEGYPNGTVYDALFSGSASSAEKVDDYTYKFSISDLTYDNASQDEIKDGQHIIFGGDAYGIAEADQVYLYLPGKPISELPEEYLSWIGIVLTNDSVKKLPFYGLYSPKDEAGFFSDNPMAYVGYYGEPADCKMSKEMAAAYAEKLKTMSDTAQLDFGGTGTLKAAMLDISKDGFPLLATVYAGAYYGYDEYEDLSEIEVWQYNEGKVEGITVPFDQFYAGLSVVQHEGKSLLRFEDGVAMEPGEYTRSVEYFVSKGVAKKYHDIQMFDGILSEDGTVYFTDKNGDYTSAPLSELESKGWRKIDSSYVAGYFLDGEPAYDVISKMLEEQEEIIGFWGDAIILRPFFSDKETMIKGLESIR